MIETFLGRDNGDKAHELGERLARETGLPFAERREPSGLIIDRR
ncbi:hypothetical protein [Bradyrhizobium neotropicale]|nr:hypothetical protein [Bradyrhizobium neotropicale]